MRTIFVLAALAQLALAQLARVEAASIEGSAGAAVLRGHAAVIDVAATWPSSYLPQNYWKADLTLIGPSTFMGAPASSNQIARGLYVASFGTGFGLGVGLACMTRPEPYNSTRLEASIEASWRFEHVPVILTYSHLSNGGLRYPNFGRDLVMVGYRFGRQF